MKPRDAKERGGNSSGGAEGGGATRPEIEEGGAEVGVEKEEDEECKKDDSLVEGLHGKSARKDSPVTRREASAETIMVSDKKKRTQTVHRAHPRASGIWYLVSGVFHRPNRLSDFQWV